jgi:hypothetical protein
VLGGISNLEVGHGEKLGQHQQLLFTGIEWHSKFASSLWEIRWSKHLWAFAKVVEGSEIYSFGIITLGHFSSNFQSFSQSNSGSRNEITPERDVASRHRVPALQSARVRLAAPYVTVRTPRRAHDLRSEHRTSPDAPPCHTDPPSRDSTAVPAGPPTTSLPRTRLPRSSPSPYRGLKVGVSFVMKAWLTSPTRLPICWASAPSSREHASRRHCRRHSGTPPPSATSAANSVFPRIYSISQCRALPWLRRLVAGAKPAAATAEPPRRRLPCPNSGHQQVLGEHGSSPATSPAESAAGLAGFWPAAPPP